MTYFTHEFEDEIRFHEVGRARVIAYKVLFLPTRMESGLPFDTFPRLRVEGEIADVPVRGAWLPVGDGRRYFIVSPQVRKDSGNDVGDLVPMRFRIDDQDHVDIPDALRAAIERDQEIASLWDQLTSGRQRMFAVHVSTAKTGPTADRRVSEALDAMRQGITIRDLRNRPP